MRSAYHEPTNVSTTAMAAMARKGTSLITFRNVNRIESSSCRRRAGPAEARGDGDRERGEGRRGAGGPVEAEGDRRNGQRSRRLHGWRGWGAPPAPESYRLRPEPGPRNPGGPPRPRHAH